MNIPKNGITPCPTRGMTSIIGTASHVHRQKPSNGSGHASVQRATGSRASHVAFTWRLW